MFLGAVGPIYNRLANINLLVYVGDAVDVEKMCVSVGGDGDGAWEGTGGRSDGEEEAVEACRGCCLLVFEAGVAAKCLSGGDDGGGRAFGMFVDSCHVGCRLRLV